MIFNFHQNTFLDEKKNVRNENCKQTKRKSIKTKILRFFNQFFQPQNNSI